MSKIINLQATNFKRLKAVEVAPDGNIVTISGKNGQGKSSVLDAITAALAGTDKRTTPKPIRDGEEYAEIVLETDELIATRRFTHDKKPSLVVESKDGAKYPKAQAKLNDLIGKLSLDPLAFTRLSDKEQRETLLGLIDLPFDPKELDERREALYEQRREIGRQGKAIGTVKIDPDLPTEEKSANDLIQQINEAKDIDLKRLQIKQSIERTLSRRDEINLQIEALQRELSSTHEQERAALQELDELPPSQDTAQMHEQLEAIDSTNYKIRANNAARDRKQEREKLDQQYAKLSLAIEKVDKQKAFGLAQAKLPVEGLSFDEDGVLYDGIPFKQINTAAQVQVSTAMAMAMNPKLRVIRIAEGSLLDDESLEIIAGMAEQDDYQIWIETVSNGDGAGIVIEDGEIKGDDN